MAQDKITLPEGFTLIAEPGDLPKGFTIQETVLPEPLSENESRVENSMFYSTQLGIDPLQAYTLEPNLNEVSFGSRKLSDNPAVLFFKAFKHSLADKPAMMLKGIEVYTPGEALGADTLLEKSATFLRSLQDAKEKQQLQKVASGKLWPVGEDRRWWQVDVRHLPEVINTWAVNVGDQIPIMLITLAGRQAGSLLGKAFGGGLGVAGAVATAGPDPSDVVTAPVVTALATEVVKHLGGAAPLVAMEAGAFMDDAEAIGIDKDIAETFAKLYGLGSGTIEYAQQLWVLGRYSKISKPVQDKILKQVLTHIGGSVFEGIEEVSQQGLENFLLQVAVGAMKKRHPEFEGEAPKITEGLKRSGIIGAGVAGITGLPGTGMTIAQGAAARKQIASPETKEFLGEPSVAQVQEQEVVVPKEAQPPAKAITPAEAAPTTPKAEIAAPEAEVVAFAEKHVDQQGNWTLPGDTLTKELTDRADSEIVDLMNWSRGQSPHVQRNVEQNAAAILRDRGIPVDTIEWQQANLTQQEAQPPAQEGKVVPAKPKKSVGPPEEVETPAEAREAERVLDVEAGEKVSPELYIGRVTEGMKHRIEEGTGISAEAIKGFTQEGFPTIRTQIPMTRGQAEQYLEFLETRLIEKLDKNQINTESDLAKANAEWGDIKNLREVLGLEKVKRPFSVVRADKHKIKVITNVRSRIFEAIRPTDESKLTVGEVLSVTLRRSARAAKMAFAKGRAELRAQIRARKRAKARVTKAIKKVTQKVPQTVDFFFREAIEALRTDIDLKARSKKRLAARLATNEFLSRVPEKRKDIPVKLMRQLSQKSLNEFTIEELETLASEIDKLIKQGKLKRQLKLKPQLEERKRAIGTLTAATIVAKPSKAVAGPKVLSTTKNNLFVSAFDKVKLWTWRPQRLFDMLDGGKQFKGTWHRLFFDAVKEAKSKFFRRKQARKAAFTQKTKELGISAFQLSGSREVNGTRYQVQEMMGIYMASKNRLSKQILRHGHNVPDATQAAIIAELTPQELALAEFMLDDYQENYSRLRRSTIEQLNRDLGLEPNYSPIRRTEDIGKPLQVEMADAVLMRAGLRKAGVEKGFTISRLEVPPEFQTTMRLDAVNLYLDQVDKHERFIALGPQIRKMNKILANKELRKTVQDRFGRDTLEMLDSYVRAVANPYIYKQFTRPEQLSAKLRRHTAIAYLAYNLVTMGKQLPSVLLYLKDAGPSHLMASAFDFATDPRAMIKKVRALDPELAERSIERELEELKNATNASFIKQKVTQNGMEGIFLFDTIARTIGWNAVYERAKQDNMSEAEAINAARNATTRTQPAAAAEDLAAIYRTNEFLNWFTMFTNQLNQIFNIATYDIPSYLRSGQYADAALETMGLGMVAMVIWMVTNRRLPEEPEDFIDAIAEQSINAMPLVGKPIMAARKGWDNDIPVFEAIGALGQVTTDTDLTRGEVVAIAEGVSVVVGLPFTAARRTVQAIEEEQPTALLGARKPKKKRTTGF